MRFPPGVGVTTVPSSTESRLALPPTDCCGSFSSRKAERDLSIIRITDTLAPFARAAKIGLWTGGVVALLWIGIGPPDGPAVSRWEGGLLVGAFTGIVAFAIAMGPRLWRILIGL